MFWKGQNDILGLLAVKNDIMSIFIVDKVNFTWNWDWMKNGFKNVVNNESNEFLQMNSFWDLQKNVMEYLQPKMPERHALIKSPSKRCEAA